MFLWDDVKDKLPSKATLLTLEQQQKLCIARLLPLKPRVILMDEPCSALDAEGTQAIENLIDALKEQFTIVIVTHNMGQAARASEECIYMLLGEVIEHGKTAGHLSESPAEGNRNVHRGALRLTTGRRPRRLSPGQSAMRPILFTDAVLSRKLGGEPGGARIAGRGIGRGVVPAIKPRWTMAKQLPRQIDGLKQKILFVGTLVEEAIAKAILALNNRDRNLANSVIEADADIDRMEVDVEEECLKILALYQPVAADLRFVVAVLKINNDLERMGDLAKNVAKRVVFLADYELSDIPIDYRGMAAQVKSMVKESLDALVNADTALGAKGADQRRRSRQSKAHHRATDRRAHRPASGPH